MKQSILSLCFPELVGRCGWPVGFLVFLLLVVVTPGIAYGQNEEPAPAEKVNSSDDTAEAPEPEQPGAGQSDPDGTSVNLVITKQVGGRQEELEELAARIRQEQSESRFEPGRHCPEREAPRYRRKVAVAAFAVENLKQGSMGRLYDAGGVVSGAIYQQLLESRRVAPLYAPARQMFASLEMAPTRSSLGNGLDKYSAVSREMGAQFVVSGVIRDLDVSDAETWNTSYASNVRRVLFGGDTNRAFTVDVVVHDGFSGHVVYEKRYSGAGRWEFSRQDKVRFGSDRFAETDYGRMVNGILEEITADVDSRLACQPMLVPILDVDGKDLVLDIGTGSGVLPGTYMEVVRKEHSLQNPDRPPELWETGVRLHVHSLSLDSAKAWMPEYAGVINIRPGDYAVLY